MLLKVVGAILCFSAFTYGGFSLSGNLHKRLSQLRDLQGLILVLIHEIVFMNRVLTEAFEKAAQSNNTLVSEILKLASEKSENRDTSAIDAWIQAVEEKEARLSFTDEDFVILKSFGTMFEAPDVNGQAKGLYTMIDRLKIQEVKAEEDIKKYSGMYKSLGVLAGLAAIIILF